eukprot:s3469_g7.t1
MCRYCHTRCTSWHGLIKHFTQGQCSRIQQAVAEGQSIEQLHATILAEENIRPPHPPSDLLWQETPFMQQSHPALRDSIHLLVNHSDDLRRYNKTCMICGQHMVKQDHIKNHWRSSHQQAWKSASYLANTEAGSMNSVLKRPCQFCGSQAKNAHLHARQCPVLFQILAVRHLLNMGTQPQLATGVVPKAPKQSETQPAYRTFVSPILQAFRRSSGQEVAVHTKTSTTSRFLAQGMQPTGATTSETFNSIGGNNAQHDHSHRSSRSIIPELPWQGKLLLRNPHSLCYVNAGFVSLLYATEQAGCLPDRITFAVNLCKKAVEKNSPFLLTVSSRFRALTPAWSFDDRQRDSAEYLHVLLEDGSIVPAHWLSRHDTSEGVRVRAQGGLPIAIPLRYAGTLQQLIYGWHQDGDTHAMLEPYPLICVQLNRYLPGRKNQASVHFDSNVLMPVFLDGMRVEWYSYQVISGIVHRGRYTDSGHYQALLQVGDSWFQTDDNACARPVALNVVQRSNIYLLWL